MQTHLPGTNKYRFISERKMWRKLTILYYLKENPYCINFFFNSMINNKVSLTYLHYCWLPKSTGYIFIRTINISSIRSCTSYSNNYHNIYKLNE